MSFDRLQRKEAEFERLKKEYERNPELFAEATHVEDNAHLSNLGISIPGKDRFPLGLLKLWPEDFIVEELGSGSVRTVGNRPAAYPQEEGPTLYATLVKCNISTFEAVTDIAKNLNIRVEDVSFAGLKDKNALTAQKISLRRVDPQKAYALKSPYYFLTDWESGKGIAERGKLDGNRFTILIRTEESFFDPERFSEFGEHLRQVKEHGFANFFYLQRFGTARLRNYHWAWLILLGKYEEAVIDFITYAGEREIPYFKQMRTSLAEEIPNWNQVCRAMEPFPIIFEQELLVAEHLRSHPGDYIGALQTLPEQITFWLYALSSALFNKRISEYLASGEKLPETLPFFLSHEERDWSEYRHVLERMGIYPPSFKNLRPFPQVIIKSRRTATWSHVDFRKAELVKEGIVFEFDLGKGEYATTMLSHMFNLVSGLPPTSFPATRIDAKTALGEPSLAAVLDRFAEVIRAKSGGFMGILADS